MTTSSSLADAGVAISADYYEYRYPAILKSPGGVLAQSFVDILQSLYPLWL